MLNSLGEEHMLNRDLTFTVNGYRLLHILFMWHLLK